MAAVLTHEISLSGDGLMVNGRSEYRRRDPRDNVLISAYEFEMKAGPFS
jgi:hypothetical protein